MGQAARVRASLRDAPRKGSHHAGPEFSTPRAGAQDTDDWSWIAHDSGSDPVPVNGRFSSLIGHVYEGASEAVPWQAFVEALRLALDARNVIVTLHHADDEGSDIYVMARVPGDEIDWAAVEATYRAELMMDDPLRPDLMEPGQVSLVDRSTTDLKKHAIFEQIGLSQTLRMCVAEPSGIRCWVDVIRSHKHAEPLFTEADLALMHALTPHLSRALGLYAQLKRQETEKAIYESMAEHFGLGCVLLNDQGEVILVNRVAASIIEQRPGIAVNKQRLVLSDRSAQLALNEAIAAVISARWQAGASQGGNLIRVGDSHDRLVGLLVYPAPLLHYYRGGQSPCVVVHLSDLSASLEALRPSQGHSVSRIAQLFNLTRQEATLALLLAYGNTLTEAAQEMGIAEIAARNYSKKIYGKMGIAGQADLIRLTLRSIAFLR